MVSCVDAGRSRARARCFSLLFLLVLIDPDDLLRHRDQPLVAGGDMTAAARHRPAAGPPRHRGPGARPAQRCGRARNPWRHPWFLEGFTWLYLVWSLVPIGLAVLFSFNNGRSQTVWQGFSWRWYFADPVNSVLHDPQPARRGHPDRPAVGLHHPDRGAARRGVRARHQPVARPDTASTFNFVMILSFVIPELIFGVAMFFVFTQLFTSVGLGTLAEVLGPGHLERELAGHHRAGPAGHHRQAVRGGGRRPRRRRRCRPCAGCMLPLLDPGHLRQRGPGLLRRHRRLRASSTC